jgi:hypothetical protein
LTQPKPGGCGDVRCRSTFGQISDVGSFEEEGDTNVDLFDVVRSCFRRWYVLLPLLLITAWYGHQAYAAVKPVYYSQAVIGLAPPNTRVESAAPGQPLPRNGLLDTGGATLLANMSALGLREPAVVDRVVAAGGLHDYSAKLFPVPATAPPIPLVLIEVLAPDPAAATKTLELVSNEMTASLETVQRQAGVPADMMVGSFVVTPPSVPIAAMPTRTRSTASIFVAGLGLSVLVTVLVDVLLVRLRKRIKVAPQAPSSSGPLPSSEHTPGDDRTPTNAPVPDGVVVVNEGVAGAR